ncbi:MAG: hypothetical protein ACREDO_05730 [Methyloceanibacter sp.]
MKCTIAIVAAAALLMGTTALYAGKETATGASGYAPGAAKKQQGAEDMAPDASEYSTGKQAKQPDAEDSAPGASEYSPGKQMQEESSGASEHKGHSAY